MYSETTPKTAKSIEVEVEKESLRRNSEIIGRVLAVVADNILGSPVGMMATLERVEFCEHQVLKAKYLRIKKTIQQIKKDLKLDCFRWEDPKTILGSLLLETRGPETGQRRTR
jgi:hypothetical protein